MHPSNQKTTQDILNDFQIRIQAALLELTQHQVREAKAKADYQEMLLACSQQEMSKYRAQGKLS